MTVRGEFHYSSTPHQEATGCHLARRPIASRNHRPRPTPCGTQTEYSSTPRHVLSQLSCHDQPHFIDLTVTLPCVFVSVSTLLSRGGMVSCVHAASIKHKPTTRPRVQSRGQCCHLFCPKRRHHLAAARAVHQRRSNPWPSASVGSPSWHRRPGYFEPTANLRANHGHVQGHVIQRPSTA